MKPGQESRCPWTEQSVGWALHALEPAEEADAAAHLPTCDTCQELVGQTEELLAMLGSSQPSVEPPAELRASLLARVAETPQQLSALPPRPTPARPTAVLPPQQRPEPEPERDTERTLPGRPDEPPQPAAAAPPSPRRWRVALVAAAVAVALGLGGLAIRTAQVDTARDSQISQTQQLASMVSELQRPGGKAAMLAPTNSAPVAAVVVADGERKLITVGMMPNPSSTHTYVLWGTGAGAPRALDTFDITTTSATGPLSVGSVGGADSYTGYAISLEPGRSAPASPSTVVASGQVQS